MSSSATRFDQTTPEGGTVTPVIAPGELLGRYTVREKIGSGGMGEVFSAHDPELDRLVAVKVIRPSLGGTSSEARARFQREAQAMARLNHPNVVAVFEVGTIGTDIYVAMELVRGPTLAAWLADSSRPWRAVVDVFLQAGQGLAAAHDAGIVHRDFKPSNVIIGDRVRVADFGLARTVVDVDRDEPSSGSMLEINVTQTGRALGTPRYMSPEQHAGGAVTPLSDQYSFGLALGEALERGRHAPAWLRAIVARAVQPRAEDRYPSMRLLLRDLRRDPDRTKKRLLAVGALVGIAAAMIVAGRHRVAASPCVGSEAQIASLWDTDTRSRVAAAFDRTGRPNAADTFGRVDAIVKARLSAWADAHHDACAATYERHEQSEALLDLRTRCLQRTREDAATTIKLLGEANDRAVDRAVAAVTGVADPRPCADTAALTAVVPPPRDAAVIAEDAAVELEAGRIEALSKIGRGKDSLAAAHALLPRAGALPYAPGRAVAMRAIMISEDTGGDPAKAVPLAYQALAAAEEAHDDSIRVEALTLLAFIVGLRQHHFAEAEVLGQIAQAAIGRETTSPRLLAMLHHRLGAVAVAKGDLTAGLFHFVAELGFAIREAGWTSRLTSQALSDISDAEAQLEDTRASVATGVRSIQILEAVVGPDHPFVATALHNQGLAAFNGSDYDAAATRFLRALDILEKAYGPTHESTGNTLQALARTREMQGRLAEARDLAEKSGQILERVSPEAPFFLINLSIRAEIATKLGELDEALELAQRSVALQVKVDGSDHESTGRAEDVLATVLARRGDLAQATKHFESAAATLEKALGGEHSDTLEAQVALAEVLARQGSARARAGAAICGKSLPIGERVLGARPVEMVNVLSTCAGVFLAAGDLARGRVLAERADAMATPQMGPEMMATARLAHAQALRTSDRARGCALGREAIDLAQPLPGLRSQIEKEISYCRR